MKLDIYGIVFGIIIAVLIMVSCSTDERSEAEPLLYCCETAVFEYESLNDNILTDDNKLFKKQTCFTKEEWENGKN